MIQFTTVTLLYSFASSLGDFQFLYIDLFVIIPIAVASELCHTHPCWMRALAEFDSGTDPALSKDPPKAPYCIARLKEGVDQYHWADCHQFAGTDAGVCLGSAAAVVSAIFCHLTRRTRPV